MILKDGRGNELVEIIYIDENTAMQKYAPITGCLAVVMIGGDYLLGWNHWRKDWEIFGGCMEPGETMRQCIIRDCLEEIGIADVKIDYIGLLHFRMVPDYFSTQYRREYTGLYGIKLLPEDLPGIEQNRLDREEIERIALLKDIGADERIAEIDRELLNFYGGKTDGFDGTM